MNSDHPSPQSSAAATPPLPPPRVPDHELLRRIGRGAYGEVWLARSVTGAFRAVKIVHRQSFDHDRPFEREFEGILKFEPISRRHDSQVDILHVGRGDGCFYYVMELADDQATGGQINPDNYTPRTLKSDVLFHDRLPFEECVRIGIALTTALENLHGNGLVHRDVKPSNIIFVNGVPKLADIGLVTGVDATRSYVGTEGFAAPEGPGSPQADLYSLGKVLYEIFTGKDRQEFPELPTQLRELPDRAGLLELNAVIARACRHDPKDRYASATAMRADLELLQSGKSLARLHRTEKQLRFVQRAGGLVAVLAAIIALGWWWQVKRTRIVRDLATEKAKLADTNARLAQENRHRLVQLQSANGIRAMDSGDPVTAALWFSEVLKLSEGEAKVEQRQRFRLGTLFQYLPKPVGIFHREYNTHAFTSVLDDGKRLMTAGTTPGPGLTKGEIKVWELTSGRLVDSINLTNIWGVRVSPSGRWAIVSDPQENRLCEVGDELRVVGTLPFGGSGERGAFAGDETKLAISRFDRGREVHIIEIPSSRSLTPPLVHSNSVIFLTFDREGRQLVTGTKVEREPATNPREPDSRRPTGQARVWNAITGEPITDWLECDEEVSFATFSPDGKALAVLGDPVASTDSGMVPDLVKVFDLPSGRLRFPPLVHKDTVRATGFSPDGRYLATASADQTVTLWNAHSGKPVHPPLKHPASVDNVCFSPDGKWLATVAETEVCVWNVRSGAMLTPPLKHGARLPHVAFSPEGSRLITATKSGLIRIWNLADAEPALPPFQNPDRELITSATFSPDGNQVVTASPAGELQVWQMDDGRRIGRRMEPKWETKDQSAEFQNRATWSADGRWLAVPSGDWTVRIWDALTGEPQSIILRHSNLVLSAEFSPITNHVVTASADGTARVWEAATGQPVTPPLQHSNAVVMARFSPDGRQIATASFDRTARVWNAATGAPVTPPLHHDNTVEAVAFSPDGLRIVTAAGVNALIWDATTGQRLVGPMLHLNTVIRVCFSPNGQHLLTASMDHTARVWDARTGQPAAPPLTHAGYVVACAFSPDGKEVVTGSYDGTARVWDAATGEPLGMPFRHNKGILDAAFSPDGRRVVTTSLDGTAQLWGIPTLDWATDEIEALAQFLAGGKVGQSGTVEPLDSRQLDAVWERVSRRLHGNARTSSEDLVRWHHRRLALCELSTDWFAAEFHARWLVKLQPGDDAAQADLARIKESRPPARESGAPSDLIDLSAFYNASLSVPWYPGPNGNHLAEVPRGIQTFAGTRFDVRGLIQVLGEPYAAGQVEYPKEVNGIRINRRLARLQFLHSIQGSIVPDGTRVGHYLIHFANGRREEIPIIYGRDARDWHEHPNVPVGVSDAVIAWKGTNPAVALAGTRGIRLFKRTWENPAPDVEVTMVDFVAEPESAHPFLVALTAE